MIEPVIQATLGTHQTIPTPYARARPMGLLPTRLASEIAVATLVAQLQQVLATLVTQTATTRTTNARTIAQSTSGPRTETTTTKTEARRLAVLVMEATVVLGRIHATGGDSDNDRRDNINGASSYSSRIDNDNNYSSRTTTGSSYSNDTSSYPSMNSNSATYGSSSSDGLGLGSYKSYNEYSRQSGNSNDGGTYSSYSSGQRYGDSASKYD